MSQRSLKLVVGGSLLSWMVCAMCFTDSGDTSAILAFPAKDFGVRFNEVVRGA